MSSSLSKESEQTAHLRSFLFFFSFGLMLLARLSSRMEPNLKPASLTHADEQKCFEELGLVVDPDNYQRDRAEVKKILFECLNYPSEELAKLHEQSDRLGTYDLIGRQSGKTIVRSTYQAETLKVCPCCGFKRQPSTLPLGVSFDDLSGLGSSTILLFEMMKYCVMMLLAATFVYSAYAVAQHIQVFGWECPFAMSCTNEVKHNGTNHTHLIQSWLGAVLVAHWGLLFLWMNLRERQIELDVDKNTISASDFSIMISNLPVEIDQQTLQQILYSYREEIDREHALPPFKIVKFNVAEPYFVEAEDISDEELSSLYSKRRLVQQQTRRWILNRIRYGDAVHFQVSSSYRQQVYTEFDSINSAIKVRVREIAQRIKRHFVENRRSYLTKTVFVTFRYSQCQHAVVLNNRSLLQRFRAFLFCQQANMVPLRVGDINMNVLRAPEPEDILYCNIGVPVLTVFLRKLITYFASALMLLTTFTAIYLLDVVLMQYQNGSPINVIVAPLVITIINEALEALVKYLTEYERNHTRIHNQKSRTVKTIITQIINMVVMTYLQKVVIQHNIHDKKGLAEGVFFLAIVNAFLPPAIRILDLQYLIKSYKRSRLSSSVSRLSSSQKELNEAYEGRVFDVGDEYNYPIKTLVFTSCYLSLQPIIAVFSAVGIVLMYCINKYCLLRRSKRPPPGSDLVHHTLCQFIYMCPLLFCGGAVFWPILEGQFSIQRYYPYLLGVAFSVLIMMLPMQAYFDTFLHEHPENMIYEEQRIHFSAEYDRLNPSTKYQGKRDYHSFLNSLKRKASINPSSVSVNVQDIVTMLEIDPQAKGSSILEEANVGSLLELAADPEIPENEVKLND